MLQWHFARENGGSTRQVTITFSPTTAVAMTGATNATVTGVVPPPPPPPPQKGGELRVKLPAGAAPFSGTLRSVNVIGLSDEARAYLLSRLPVHQANRISEETGKRTMQAVRDFDEHLQARFIPMRNGDTTIMIVAPNSSSMQAPASPVSAALRTGSEWAAMCSRRNWSSNPVRCIRLKPRWREFRAS